MIDHSKLHGLIETLKQQGERITKARVSVLEFLCQRNQPVTVKTIQRHIPGTNIVTLYRMLDHWVELGVVHVLAHNGKEQLFELADPWHSHHHHTLCRRCGKVTDIRCELTLPALKNFVPESHVITVYGHCVQCPTNLKK